MVEISDTTAKKLPTDWSLKPGKDVPLSDGTSMHTHLVHMGPINYKCIIKSRKLYPRLGDFHSWFCASVKHLNHADLAQDTPLGSPGPAQIDKANLKGSRKWSLSSVGSPVAVADAGKGKKMWMSSFRQRNSLNNASFKGSGDSGTAGNHSFHSSHRSTSAVGIDFESLKVLRV